LTLLSVPRTSAVYAGGAGHDDVDDVDVDDVDVDVDIDAV
jgi:hypothetical protein